MYRFTWALTMAERLAEGPQVFVPRLNSLFSERDVENAIMPDFLGQWRAPFASSLTTHGKEMGVSRLQSAHAQKNAASVRDYSN